MYKIIRIEKQRRRWWSARLQSRVGAKYALSAFGAGIVIFAAWALSASTPPLSQAAAAINAQIWPEGFMRDARIAQWDAVGSSKALASCMDTKPGLPHISPKICGHLFCTRSLKDKGVWIDLSFRAFTPISMPSDQAEHTCHDPFGGQIGHIDNPRSSPIQVSFIFTAYNKTSLVLRAILEAFRTSREAESVEFIVVDDGSTEDTSEIAKVGEVIRDHFGVSFKMIRNSVPTGFVQANNAAAREANGTYLAIINSDAFVTRGWLSALLGAMKPSRIGAETKPVGIAGPLFLNSTGFVMEAGGIVWNDATAANYGRRDKPTRAYLYSRSVDYISAACWLIRRDVFVDKLGGFDERYGIGYWEDTDVSMAVRKIGMDVRYVPAAVVIHDEGESLSQVKLDLMNKNRKLFHAKWRNELEGTHMNIKVPAEDAADRLVGGIRLLWIDDIVPETDRDAGSIRTYNLLRALISNGYRVSFQPMAGGRESHYRVAVRGLGVDVLPVKGNQWRSAASGGSCRYDVIVIARQYIFERVEARVTDMCPDTPIVFDTVDISFLREARMAISGLDQGFAVGPQAWAFQSTQTTSVQAWLDTSTSQEAANVRKTLVNEIRFMHRANATIVVSSVEVPLVNAYAPNARIHVVSNVFDDDAFGVTESASGLGHVRGRSCRERAGILFVGNFNHHPNQQAVRTLVDDVLPILTDMLPSDLARDMVLNIVGSNTAPTASFASSKVPIIFHGWLSDEELALLYDSVKVVVAPLLSGAGVKGKVNQAMIYGVPVVATPVAAEGMRLVDGETAMVGTSLASFANKTAQVYMDCGTWSKLARGGFESVRRQFSLSNAVPDFLAIFDELLPAKKTDNV